MTHLNMTVPFLFSSHPSPLLLFSIFAECGWAFRACGFIFVITPEMLAGDETPFWPPAAASVDNIY